MHIYHLNTNISRTLIINSVYEKCWWVKYYEGDWEVRIGYINVCIRWRKHMLLLQVALQSPVSV